MPRTTRRTFLQTATATAVGTALWNSIPRLMANPLGLPIGLQLYSVRDVLPKDYEGTLKQLSAMGYREVEAAGFFGRSSKDVKAAMDGAGLRCVSAHYSLKDLLPKLEATVQYGKELGLQYIVCAAPMLKDPTRAKDPTATALKEGMTLEDWKWNAEQFNHIGERVSAEGMKFAYHNHTPEFRSENGVMFYDELMRLTDPVRVHFELDCGWVAVAGQNPVDLLTRYSTRIVMMHVKDFKLGKGANALPVPPSTEMGHGAIDYHPIFAAAKKAKIEHAFVEQEEFDIPEMDALKMDAEFMKGFAG
jgi:sugar phosphate isomerase/epimerase